METGHRVNEQKKEKEKVPLWLILRALDEYFWHFFFFFSPSPIRSWRAIKNQGPAPNEQSILSVIALIFINIPY